MDENKIIAYYFDKIQEHVNAMTTCRDTIIDQQVVDKILISLSQRFDHVVVAIEDTKDLKEMVLETLQHSLKAPKYKINERMHNQALQARVTNTKKPYNVTHIMSVQKKSHVKNDRWHFCKLFDFFNVCPFQHRRNLTFDT